MNINSFLLVILLSTMMTVARVSASPFVDPRHIEPSDMDSIPHAVSPRNDSTFNCIPAHIPLRWTPATTFDNSYFVEVSPDSSFEKLLVSDVVVIDTFDFIAVPKADTTLYWRVRTQFDTTKIWHFNLRLPRPTTIVSPKADTVTLNPIPFVWNHAPGGNSYELSIESEAYSRKDTTSDTTIAITLLGFKTYTWKVRPLCGDGAGEWSTTGHFYLNTETNEVRMGDAGMASLRVHHDAFADRLIFNVSKAPSLLQHYVLYNSLGLVVSQADLGGITVASIPLRSAPAGLYILVVSDLDTQYRTTLILDR